jgi:hypothetical protein
MAMDAGLSENAVYRIVKYGKGANPATLKALADTWGRTPDERATDYRELMTRAGYDVPEPAPYREPETMTATERLAIDVLRSMPDEQKQATILVIKGWGTPSELTRLLFSDVVIGDEEIAEWMDANHPEPRSVANVPAVLLTEDERYVVERLRKMPPDGLAILAVGLEKFSDARSAGNALGPQLGQMWLDMSERVGKLPVPDQRRLLAYIERRIADGTEATPGRDIPEDATLERLLEVVLRLSEAERRQWIYNNLQRLQS